MNLWTKHLIIILTILSMSFLPTLPTFAETIMSGCVITKVGNPQGQISLPPNCQTGGEITGDAKELARQILANKNIKLLNSSAKDIQATIDGKQIQNSDSCGKAVSLDPALLKVMLQLAQNHTYDVWNIVTLHGCDEHRHPKGKGIDIGQADGKGSWQNAAFRQHAADVLPANSELLQTPCPGTPPVKEKNKLIQGDDKCNHQHISVP